MVVIIDFQRVIGHNDHNQLEREGCDESASCKYSGSQKTLF